MLLLNYHLYGTQAEEFSNIVHQAALAMPAMGEAEGESYAVVAEDKIGGGAGGDDLQWDAEGRFWRG